MHRLLVIAAFSLPALVSDNVLEPSIQNEVDHAISLGEKVLADAEAKVCAVSCAETNAPALSATNRPREVDLGDVFSTNGMSATAVALKIVSMQGSDGRWTSGTNDVTSVALDILRSLGEAPADDIGP